MRRLVRVRSSHVARGTVVIVMRGTATEPTAGPADARIPADPLVSGAPGGPARGRIAPLVMVVFGASGDLARRKLLPALYDLAYEGLLPDALRDRRLGREPPRRRGLPRARPRRRSRSSLATGWTRGAGRRSREGLSYVSAPLDDPDAFGPLRERLVTLDAELGAEGRRLFYCATPPSAFPTIVRRIGEARPRGNGRGSCSRSRSGTTWQARASSAASSREVFDEPQVFRIDHYVGKEAVQNILVFRFANSMVERAWCGEAVDHVQITVAESAGIERRGRYYEEAGALRDMVQNHLLQVLAFVAMEPPDSLAPEDVRDRKAELLEAVRPFSEDELVRGQYVAGVVEGREVPGYREEELIAPRLGRRDVRGACAPGSTTRAGRASRSSCAPGKRLPHRATEVAIVLREPEGRLFADAGIARLPAHHLALRIQPDEGISLVFRAKEPGPGMALEAVPMDFAYGGSFRTRSTGAYERLLHDAMASDQTLFLREDAVERSWEIVAPVLDCPGTVTPTRRARGARRPRTRSSRRSGGTRAEGAGRRWRQEGGVEMQRVVVDHFGGPEVLRVVEEDDPRPGPGEVRVRVLAAGVSFTDAQLRAGTYIPGGPKPPFTPGYELVGVVEELGPGCSRLREGDRIGALTVWGADADRVCVPEAGAVEVPEDLDPGGGREPPVPVHDRLPGASPHGDGEARGDGARARRGRAGSASPSSSSERWPGFASSGPARLATAPRSSGSARSRSTIATRTSWRGCAS